MNAIGRAAGVFLILGIITLSLGFAFNFPLYLQQPKTVTVTQTDTQTSSVVQVTILYDTATYFTTRTIRADYPQVTITKQVLIRGTQIDEVCIVELDSTNSTVYKFPSERLGGNFNATITTIFNSSTTTIYRNITIVRGSSTCVVTNGPLGNNSTNSCFCI